MGIAGWRPSRARQLREKGRNYQAKLLLEKRTKVMTRLQRMARATEDLLYSANNHVAVKEELGQYSDIFKLLSTYHEEYCELVDADDQKHQVNWFDDLGQDVFNFKHKIHNWLEEVAEARSPLGADPLVVVPNHQQSWSCLKRWSK